MVPRWLTTSLGLATRLGLARAIASTTSALKNLLRSRKKRDVREEGLAVSIILILTRPAVL